MIILTLSLIIILLCISLYLLKAYTNKIEFYTTQETTQQNKKNNKCITVTPTDTSNMDCGAGLYLQGIFNVPGIDLQPRNSTYLKCCRIK
jgi:hypothetical protein